MKKKFALIIPAIYFYCCSLTAFASDVVDTGSAVQDIMNKNAFKGAMSYISWLSNIIDHYMTIAITLVAFFIISAALLKNVCAAAYCSNNKFWNKVHEAHTAAEAKKIGELLSGLKNVQNVSMGGIKGTLLSIVPDIKAFTDFEDQDMEPKHYWMKAIPQMLACIIIGVFVYNGYYRDTAGLVGQIGSEVVSRALASVSPSKMVDDVLLTTGTPPNIYEEDTSPVGKINYEISMALYKEWRAALSLKSTDDKTKLMRNCEYLAHQLTTDATTGSANQPNAFIAPEGMNKAMQISGLNVTLISKQAFSKMSTGMSYGGGQWYGLAAESSGNFTPDNNNNFTVRLYATSQNTDDTEIANSCKYAYVTFTLTRVDYNGANQASALTANQVIGGGSTRVVVSVPASTRMNIFTNGGRSCVQSAALRTQLDSDLASISSTVKSQLESQVAQANNGNAPDITIQNLNGPTNLSATGETDVSNTGLISLTYTATYSYTQDNAAGATDTVSGSLTIVVNYNVLGSR